MIVGLRSNGGLCVYVCSGTVQTIKQVSHCSSHEKELDGWHICGGSLISAKWVITSITCSVTTSHQVVLGEHDFENNIEVIKTVPIVQVFNNPDWNPETKEFDISLVKLAKPVGLSKTVKPVCLPAENEIYTGQELCVTTGWGLKRSNCEMPLCTGSKHWFCYTKFNS
ncbi:hypothetical protein NDU88_003776 [Pleurodeles waltl]|uniref:Peptidase S1 domain-containing protein n=1 Tax=Pleurodeles waltl TaxID=8319 RepID=A0AAV7QD03_PLEWA|nr:hypothetical protein NDU88_003776 [Pleurodeles waltl]